MLVQDPHKELRFTRSRQAAVFWIAAAMLAAAALVIGGAASQRAANPDLPHPLWALVPLLLGWPAVRTARRCSKHAYLILTPVGLEIFPLFGAERGLQLVAWQQIDAVEWNPARTRLTLHFNAERTAGIHLSLRPLTPAARGLLEAALAGRLRERAAGRGEATTA